MTRVGRTAVIVAGLLASLAGWRRQQPAHENRTAGGGWILAIVRQWGVVAAVLAALAAAGGLVVVVSGVVPMKASSGHWAITEWFLQFAKRRSIATHSLFVSPPPLDDPALVLKGAGHYDIGCRPCHGGPTLDQPRIAEAMLPRPPDLRVSVARYDRAALFYIVKHGLKFTGMPAWPAPVRDDEVWAIVAFLLALPDMTPGEYERMVAGPTTDHEADVPIADLLPPTEVPEAIVESCARCHGLAGRGRDTGAFPRLDGQSPAYLEASLRAFRTDDRHSGVMEPIAAALGPSEIAEVARYYGRLGRSSAIDPPQAPAETPGRGAAIATRGIPERLVPPCQKCHGPGGPARNPIYPSLAGQYAGYLRLQLMLFQTRTRGGTAYHAIMQRVAASLTLEDMREVAEYYANLPGGDPQTPP
jgi:cytochrome c553